MSRGGVVRPAIHSFPAVDSRCRPVAASPHKLPLGFFYDYPGVINSLTPFLEFTRRIMIIASLKAHLAQMCLGLMAWGKFKFPHRRGLLLELSMGLGLIDDDQGRRGGFRIQERILLCF